MLFRSLSVDINADTDKCSSEKVYQWLDENAYKYGFVKRYPEDKTDITGISNEPDSFISLMFYYNNIKQCW